MPPHPHHHHSHHGGGFRGGWGGPFYGGDTIVIEEAPCTAVDPQGRLVAVPCPLPWGLGADQVDVIDEIPPAVSRLRSGIRQAIRLASGKRLPGVSAYYSYPGANRMRFPFQWGGWPGGQPRSRVAAEARELSGGDLWESGLNPYSLHYPPLQGRGLVGMGGVLDLFGNLSNMEKKAVTVGAVGLAAFLAWKHLRGRRRGRKVNPARIRRGRTRLQRRRRVRRR